MGVVTLEVFLTDFFVPGYRDELGWVRTAGGVFKERNGDFGWQRVVSCSVSAVAGRWR